MKGPARIDINHVTKNLAFAAFPGKYQAELYEAVKPLYPNIIEAKNVLETGFLDLNAVEHPPQILCNAGWVEHTAGDYLFYYEGTTPAVGRVIDALDRERMAVAAAAAVPAKPFVQYFYESGYTTARAAATGSAYAALQESAPNRWIKGPKNLDHRYVHEDVGWGIVPWSELGRMLEVATPVIDALITLASAMNGIDYRREGLTLAKMGLAGKDAAALDRYLYEGIR
jgi:opine dehydrogenase